MIVASKLICTLLVAVLAFPATDLMELDRRFARETAARGAEGFLSFFAQDASIFPARSPVITGKETIRAHYQKVFATPGFYLKWEPTKADIAASGDLGYTWGRYESPAGRGKYVTIWKKQPNGEWKVVADIGNPD